MAVTTVTGHFESRLCDVGKITGKEGETFTGVAKVYDSEPALLDGLEAGGLLDPVLHASLAHKVTQHRHRHGWSTVVAALATNQHAAAGGQLSTSVEEDGAAEEQARLAKLTPRAGLVFFEPERLWEHSTPGGVVT